MSRIKICNDAPVYKAADLQISILAFLICEPACGRQVCGSIYVAQIYPAYGII